MGVVGIKRCAQLLQRIEGQLVAENVRQRADDRPVLARIARRVATLTAMLARGLVTAERLRERGVR